MKLRMNLWAMAALTAGALTFSSCEKILEDATETADSAEDFAQDQTAISSMMDLAQDIAETQGFLAKNGNSILPEGVNIEYVDTVFTDNDGIEIILDLSNGVLCNDGWWRRGKFKLTSNEKKFSEVGAKVSLSLPSGQASMWRDGSSDSITTLTMMSTETIDVTRTAANTFKVDYTFTFSIGDDQNNIYLQYPASGNYTIEQTAGMNVPGAKDDEFMLSGSSTGENHNGTGYTMTITESLIRKVDESCSKTFIKGKMELKNDGSSTGLKLDFGDGKCDNDVEITLPGGIKKSYTVK